MHRTMIVSGLVVAADGWCSPVVADGKLICYSGRGVQVIRATPEKYAAPGFSPLPYLQYTSPAVANGKLYVRWQKGAACFDITAAAVAAAQAAGKGGDP